MCGVTWKQSIPRSHPKNITAIIDFISLQSTLEICLVTLTFYKTQLLKKVCSTFDKI